MKTGKKPNLMLIFSLLISQIISGQTTINNSNVSGNWKKENSPYLVTTDIVIPQDSSLQIEAGTEIIFQGNYSFTINGSIRAEGQKNDSIKFTSSAGTNWQGLSFYGGEEHQSILSFCIIEKGEKEEGGGIYSYGNNRTLIENITITKCKARNGAGIYLGGDLNKSFIVRNTIIKNNIAQHDAGGVYIESGNSIFQGCEIVENQSLMFSPAIRTTSRGYSPEFINCTVCNNVTTENEFYTAGAIRFSSETILKNSVVYHNQPNGIFVEDETAKPEITYCLIQGQLKVSYDDEFAVFQGKFENNLMNVDPLFNNWKEGDYSLTPVSNCINKGDPDFYKIDYDDDITGNERIYKGTESRIDIGAAEFQGNPSNRAPLLTGDKEFFLPYNSKSTIRVKYFDAETGDEGMEVQAYFENDSGEIDSLDIDYNSIILGLRAKTEQNNESKLIVHLNDNSGEENSVVTDTLTVHFSNWFSGVITDTIIFKDSINVIGNIVIEPQGKLIVQPGAFIEFQGDYKIDAFGDIKLEGNANEKIILNSKDSVGFHQTPCCLKKNGWGGIIIHSVDSLMFRHVMFRNTVEGGVQVKNSNGILFENCSFHQGHSNWEGNAGISADTSSLIITNCYFEKGYCVPSPRGTYVHGMKSDITLKNSIFNTNTYNTDELKGEAVFLLECKANVDSCQFLNTRFDYQLSLLYVTDAVITNNLFQNNSSEYCLNLVTTDGQINNNKIINNIGRGINSDLSNVNIVNNLIAYNFYPESIGNFIAVGIYVERHGENQSVNIINNTIVRNGSFSPQCHAVYFSYATGKVLNNILWDNSPHEIGAYNGVPPQCPYPVITNNVIKRGYYFGENFIEDPQFAFSDSLDFSLSSQSYCIDKGIIDNVLLNCDNDILGNPRTNSATNIIDIGAYEYQYLTSTRIHDLDENEILTYPNPADEIITFQSKSNKQIDKVDIFSSSGIPVKSKKYYQSKKICSISVNDLKAGIYVYTVFCSNRFYRGKFIKK